MSLDVDHTGRDRGLVLGLSEAERARAFRGAQRHSILVKVLKVCLPLAAVGVVSLYFIPGELSFDFGGATASVDTVSLESGNLKMTNPTLSGVHPSYGRYEIRADSATQSIESPQEVALHRISGTIVAPDGAATTLSAASGLFDTKARKLTFSEGVSIDGRESLSVKLRSATVRFDDQLILSREPVSMAFRGSQIEADALELHTGDARVVFSGRVKVRLDPSQQREAE